MWVKRWGPPVALMILIFLASSIPSVQMPRFDVWDVLVKKGGHVTGYALLAAFYLRGLAWRRTVTRADVGLAVLLAVLYALTDEFHQRFVPGRGATPVDVGIDALGAVAGAAIYLGARLSAGTETRR